MLIKAFLNLEKMEAKSRALGVCLLLGRFVVDLKRRVP